VDAPAAMDLPAAVDPPAAADRPATVEAPVDAAVPGAPEAPVTVPVPGGPEAPVTVAAPVIVPAAEAPAPGVAAARLRPWRERRVATPIRRAATASTP